MASSLMNNDERYRHAPLDLTADPDDTALARVVSSRCQMSRPRNQFHTLLSSSRRLHDDLWQEYRLECDIREREGLPFVSLPEFETMRDWADRVDEPQDVAWPNVTMEMREYSPSRVSRDTDHDAGECRLLE